MAMPRLSIRITKQLREHLEDMVRHTGRKESEIVRDALEEYWQRHSARPSVYDLALKAGALGVAKDLPPDLSTNPKYMEGFGRD